MHPPTALKLTIPRSDWTYGHADMGFISPHGRSFLGHLLLHVGIPPAVLLETDCLAHLLSKYRDLLPPKLLDDAGTRSSQFAVELADVNARTDLLQHERETWLTNIARHAGIEVSFE